MANPIRFKDFADLSDAKEAGKIFDDLEKDIKASFVNIGTVTKKQLQEINDAIVKLRDTAKTIGFSRSSQDNVKPMIKEYENLSDAQKRVIETLKGISQTEQFATKSIQGLKNEAKLLLKEYNAIATKENQNTESVKALADQYKRTAAEAVELSTATKRVNNEFTAATGSYNDVKLKTAQLSKELANLGGTLENGVIAYGKNENKAKELREEINKNKEALGAYEKALGQNFRNVGNYANSIIEAKRELDKQKDSLTANVIALEKQAKAAGQSADVQNRIQTELKQTREGLEKVNRELRQYGDSSRQAETVSKGVAGGVKNVALQLTGAYLGFAALEQGFRFLVRTNAEISDSLADVRKTTGLTEVGVNNLLQTLMRFEGRTSIQGLLDIAKIGGQLGIAGKDIAGFTRAVDTASIALGDEFSGGIEEISSALGKINSVYKVTKSIGVEEGIIKTGSAINALGAAGLATAPYLADFTQRLGGIASNTDQSVQNILGIAAASEELGQSSEVAAGVVTQIFSKMSTESEKFARVAGMSLEDFEELVNTDINAAFIKLLEGLQKSSGSTTEFSKAVKSLGLDGVRATGVLGALSSNTALVAEKQKLANDEFEKGTSLIEEANIKNETFGASLDKLDNAIVAFTLSLNNGEAGLAGALKTVADVMTDVIRGFALWNETMDVKQQKEVNRTLAAYADIVKGFSTEKLSRESISFNKILSQQEIAVSNAKNKVKELEEGINNINFAGKFSDGEVRRYSQALEEAKENLVQQEKNLAIYQGKHELLESAIKGGTEAIDENSKSLNVNEEALKGVSEVLKALLNLQIFRLETQLKINRELQNEEGASVIKRIGLIKDEKQLRLQIAELEKKELLANDELLANERILILEQFAEKVRSIEKDISEKMKFSIDFELPEIEEESASLFNSDQANKELEFSIKQQIKALEEGRLLGLVGQEEYVDELANLDEKRLESVIENLKKEYGYTQEILDLEIALRQKKADQANKIDEEEAQKRADIQEAAFDITNELLNAASELSNRKYEQETAVLEAKKTKEIEALESTAAYDKLTTEQKAKAKDQIEQSYARKELQLRRQQAKREKAMAMFSIVLNTAEAITKALPNVILAAAAGVIGGIQLAVVASKPLPAFEKGTKNAPEGLALVGEKGFELIERRGKFHQTNDGPQIMPLKRGDKVYTHNESLQMIKDSEKAMEMKFPLRSIEVHQEAIRNVRHVSNNDEIIRKLVVDNNLGVQKIVGAIRSQPIVSLASQADQFYDTIKKKNSRITRLNKYKS